MRDIPFSLKPSEMLTRRYPSAAVETVLPR